MNLAFGSVCSGIEAASVAWHPLGWRPAWFSEIEPFPSAVLAHHYPDVPNLGDMTTIAKRVLIGEVSAPDLLCGGTPCQAFSVAGLRASLDDERGNLTLKFVELADAIDHVRVRAGRPPAVIFWENVHGVFSTKDNAFGCFLAGLAGEDDPLEPPGGKWSNAGCVYGPRRAVAWRTLDAQYFGVAQRRRRVFVVASARNGFDPAEVLFEWDGVRRDSAPSREARQIAPTIPSRSTGGGGLGTDFDCDGGLIAQPHADISPALKARDHKGPSSDGDGDGAILVPMLAHTLRGEDFDASEDGTGRGTPLVLIAFNPVQDPIFSTDQSTHAVGCGSSKGQASVAIAFDMAQITSKTNRSQAAPGLPCSTISAGSALHVVHQWKVRRLTPRECERLQGFPDGYTQIPTWPGWRAMDASKNPNQCIADGLEVKQNAKTGKWRVKDVDGPRYKALGNSWAVPVARWIGQCIQAQLELGK